jgi:hypothetical protein
MCGNAAIVVIHLFPIEALDVLHVAMVDVEIAMLQKYKQDEGLRAGFSVVFTCVLVARYVTLRNCIRLDAPRTNLTNQCVHSTSAPYAHGWTRRFNPEGQRRSRSYSSEYLDCLCRWVKGADKTCTILQDLRGVRG